MHFLGIIQKQQVRERDSRLVLASEAYFCPSAIATPQTSQPSLREMPKSLDCVFWKIIPYYAPYKDIFLDVFLKVFEKYGDSDFIVALSGISENRCATLN